MVASKKYAILPIPTIKKLTATQLEAQLDAQETERSKSQRSVRNVDRTVKDLQLQIERKEKANAHLQEDMSRTRDKVEKLLQTIDELQSSDSTNQLSARRAERELREEKERALRLERELETWKNRGGNPGTIRRSGQWKRAATPGLEDNGIEVPKRRSSLLQREVSLSKGFL
jgi:myosin protein heavy chain